jgi:hypothetical protein
MSCIQWSWEVKLGDVIAAAAFLIASVSLLVSARSFRKTSRAQQVKSLFDVVNQHFSSAAVLKLFDKLDMNKNNPHVYKFPGSYNPGDTDTATPSKLLYAFDVVGRMLRLGILTRKDVNLIAFRVYRTLKNEEVEKFLQYLDGDYKQFSPDFRAHDDARYLFEKLNGRRR